MKSRQSAASATAVDILVRAVAPGRVIAVPTPGASAAETTRVYSALVEESLHLSVQSLLRAGERSRAVKLRVDAAREEGSVGEVSATAIAVRFGTRTASALVEVRDDLGRLGQGSLTCLVGPVGTVDERPRITRFAG